MKFVLVALALVAAVAADVSHLNQDYLPPLQDKPNTDYLPPLPSAPVQHDPLPAPAPAHPPAPAPAPIQLLVHYVQVPQFHYAIAAPPAPIFAQPAPIFAQPIQHAPILAPAPLPIRHAPISAPAPLPIQHAPAPLPIQHEPEPAHFKDASGYKYKGPNGF